MKKAIFLGGGSPSLCGFNELRLKPSQMSIPLTAAREIKTHPICLFSFNVMYQFLNTHFWKAVGFPCEETGKHLSERKGQVCHSKLTGTHSSRNVRNACQMAASVLRIRDRAVYPDSKWCLYNYCLVVTSLPGRKETTLKRHSCSLVWIHKPQEIGKPPGSSCRQRKKQGDWSLVATRGEKLVFQKEMHHAPHYTTLQKVLELRGGQWRKGPHLDQDCFYPPTSSLIMTRRPNISYECWTYANFLLALITCFSSLTFCLRTFSLSLLLYILFSCCLHVWLASSCLVSGPRHVLLFLPRSFLLLFSLESSFGTGEKVLDRTQKHRHEDQQSINGTSRKWKATIRQRTPSTGQESSLQNQIFTNPKSDRGCISKIYEALKKPDNWKKKLK